MSRPPYGEGGTSDYNQKQAERSIPSSSQQSTRGPSRSRIPRPERAASDRIRGQTSMVRPGRHTSSTMSSPRTSQEQRHHRDQLAWDVSQSYYDGSGYGDDYENGQNGHWPLSVSPYRNNDLRTVPQSPRRPHNTSGYRQPTLDHPRSQPNAASSNHQYYASPPALPHGTGQWTGEARSHAVSNQPPPQRPPPSPRPSSPQSTTPQHDVPQMSQQAAYGLPGRRQPLGPPPSARRGHHMYYPQVGPVHPIAEETDSTRSSVRNLSIHAHGAGEEDSKSSFTSSNAIPIGIPQIYLNESPAPSSDTAGMPNSNSSHETSAHQAAPEMMADTSGEMPSLRDPLRPEVRVKQPSIGKKTNPTLTDVKSGNGLRDANWRGLASLPSQQHANQVSRDTESATAQTGNWRAFASNETLLQVQPGPISLDESFKKPSGTTATSPAAKDGELRPDSHTPKGSLQPYTAIIDSSSRPERELWRSQQKKLTSNELAPRHSRSRSLLAKGDEERVKPVLAGLGQGGAVTAEKADELEQPTGRLSERTSKVRPTSYLKVNSTHEVDTRGSLTSLPELIRRATRLASNLDRGKTASRFGINWFEGAENNEKRHSASITDMLSAFPPPAATPNGSRTDFRKSLTNWSSRHRHSTLNSNSDVGIEDHRKRRRCCGIPLWLFVLITVVLILLVAAAVVIPVTFFVIIPKENDANKSSSEVDGCLKKLTCENGGSNILSTNGYCECLCVNGYTGLTCSKHAEQGCTTTSIGSTSNATIGDAIPRLLTGSRSNFSIPLDGQVLLGLFSSSDLTCSTQNALVTFNSQSNKRSLLNVRKPTPTLKAREATASDAPSSSTPTGVLDSATTMDFARVAVLYVFQASGELDNAAMAQEFLQKYFQSGETDDGATASARNLSIGGSVTCDLTQYTISLGNGTTVGGSDTT